MTDVEALYEAAVREAYGTADSLTAEAYRVKPRSRRRPAEPKPPKAVRQALTPPAYRVTSDARLLCECGAYVYTERIGNRPPAFPAKCWRCLQPLPADDAR